VPECQAKTIAIVHVLRLEKAVGGDGKVDLGHFIIMTSAERVSKHATTYTLRSSAGLLAIFLSF